MADFEPPSDPFIASGLSEQTVEVVKNYFSNLDSTTEEGAIAWAKSFSRNGVLVQAGRVVEGHDELYAERRFVRKAWPGLRHRIQRIYVLPGREDYRLMVMGIYFIDDPKSGPSIQRNTVGEFHLVEEDGLLKIQRMEIYTDPNPLLELLKL